MYIPHSKEERERILKELGYSSLEDLFSHIDRSLLCDKPLDDTPHSEEDLRRFFQRLASLNKSLTCFAGFGSYDRIIPSLIWQILSRGEFLTAYTPYQAEASQGTLQAIFEYQSVICELTGMDVANASMYDGASALAEAVLMARAIKGKGNTVVLSSGIHPLYRQVVKTYLRGYRDQVIEIPLDKGGTTNLEALENVLRNNQVHALAVSYPNFLGYVENLRDIGSLCTTYQVPFIVVADPIALSVLKPPSQFGADIVVGEGQQLGIPMNFGGPYVGFFACKKDYIRKMPGRLVGMAEDVQGNRAFTLILQTREQHIRRERATSNICTNQNLMAIANVIYVSLLGREGLREVALQSLSKALYLKNKLLDLGFEEIYDGKHLWEFALKHPKATLLHEKLLDEGFLFGVLLERVGYKDAVLLAVTEKRTKEEMDSLIESIKKWLT